MHTKQVIFRGKKLQDADKALVMLHGRGASAEDILSLAPYMKVDDFALVAPQATNHTWYPFSFLSPPKQNEPWLSSALDLLLEIQNDILKEGIVANNIYFLGFSQGACLTLEFVTRNATRFGGVVAFTGGLIGDKIYDENYKGEFGGTSVFIGTSDPDQHVPVARVHATNTILTAMKAAVTVKVYPNMGHTVNQDEIEQAKRLVFKK